MSQRLSTKISREKRRVSSCEAVVERVFCKRRSKASGHHPDGTDPKHRFAGIGPTFIVFAIGSGLGSGRPQARAPSIVLVGKYMCRGSSDSGIKPNFA